MVSLTSIIDFVDDANLLGPFFRGESWDRWRAVLRAAFALPLTDRDQALFDEVAGGRAPPRRRVKELVCGVGRGGGKDSIAAALASYIAATGDFSRLRPGERGTIMCLATDKEQAGISRSYIRANFEETELLAPLIERFDGDTIKLTNRAEITVVANNIRSPRGRTIACAIYDEAAHWLGEDYANPDVEVDSAIAPGLIRFPGSLKIIISSVHRRAGLLYDRVARFYGKDDDDILVVIGTSLQFNPTLDAVEIDRQLELDPEKAGAEYLSQWRDDLSTFLDRALVEAAIDRGVAVRAPKDGVHYQMVADPSGGRVDSFTAAVGHVEGRLLIIDAIYEKRAPFDSDVALDEVSEFAKNYGCHELLGDAYGADLIVAGFRRRGLTYKHLKMDGADAGAKLNRSEIYLNSIGLFTAGRARLPEHHRLTHQLISLQRKAARSGHDIVDHPRSGADDVANAVAGCLVALAGQVSVSQKWRAAWGDPGTTDAFGRALPPSPPSPVAPLVHVPTWEVDSRGAKI